MADDLRLGIDVDIRKSLAEIAKAAQVTAELALKAGDVDSSFRNVNKTVAELSRLFKDINLKGLNDTLNSASRGTVGQQALLAKLQAEKRQAQLQPEAIAAQTFRVRQKTEQDSLQIGRQILANTQRQAVGIESVNKLHNTTLALRIKEKEIGDAIKQGQDRESAVVRGLISEYSRLLGVQEKIKAERARDQGVERVLGDGGASILKVQNQLLINYKLIQAAYSSIGAVGNFTLELDKSFRQLQAITATTETSMVSLRDKLIDVATQTKFTAVEVTEGATILGQAGFSSKQIEISIEAIAKFASAVGTTFSNAANIATSVLNVFNLEAEKTTQVMNTITAALNQSKLTMEQFSLATQYAANIAAEAGVGIEEFTTVTGLLANAGIRSGSTIGTGFRQLLVELRDPSEELLGILKQYGLTIDDINIKNNGFIGVLKNLRDASFGTEDALKAFNLRAANVATVLLRTIDSADSFKQAITNTSAAFEANEVQSKSLSFALDNLTGAFLALGFKALEPLIPIVRTVFEGLTNFLDVLKDSQGIVTGVVTVLGLLAAKFVALRVTQLVTNLVSARTAVQGLGAALLGTSAATTTAAGSFRALSALLVPSVFTGIALAIGAVTAALVGFSSSSAAAEDSLESLKAKNEESKGKITELQTSVKNLEKFQFELASQQGKLTEGSTELNSVLQDAALKFNSLGAQIDTTGDSYETLTGKINKLTEAQRTNLKQQLENQRSLLIDLEGQQKKESDKFFEGFQPRRELTNARAGTLRTVPAAEVLAERADISSGGLRSERVRSLVEQTAAALQSRQTATPTELSRLQREINNIRDGGTVTKIEDESLQKLGKLLQEAVGTLGKEAAVVIQREGNAKELSDEDFKDANKETAEVLRGLSADLKEAQEARRKSKPEEFDVANYVVNTQLENNKKIIGEIVKDAKEKGAEDVLFRVFPEINQLQSEAIRGVEAAGKDKLDADLKKVDLTLAKVEAELALLRTRQGAANSDSRGAIGAELIAKEDEAIALKRRQFELKQLKDAEAYTDELAKNLRKSSDFQERSQIKELELQAEKERTIASVNQRTEKVIRESDRTFTQAVDLMVRNFTATAKLFEIQRRTLEAEFQRRAIGRNTILSPDERIYVSEADRRRAQQAQRADDITLNRRQAILTRNEIAGASVGEGLLSERIQDLAAERAELEKKFETASATTQRDLKKQIGDVDSALQKANEAYDSQINRVAELKLELEKLNAEYDEFLTRNEQTKTSDSVFKVFKDELDVFLDDMSNVNTRNIELAEGFRGLFSDIRSSMASTVREMVTGTSTIGDAFKNLGRRILESMLDLATNQAAASIFGLFTGAFTPSGAPVPGGIGPTNTSPAGGFFSSIFSFFKGYANGGLITGGKPGKDSVPVLAMPGEYTVKKSAVDSVGVGFMNQLNALGSTAIENANGSQTSSGSGSGGGTVNVYIVSKDSVPPLGPNDVLAVVQDDIARGGATRKLIKSVAVQ